MRYVTTWTQNSLHVYMLIQAWLPLACRVQSRTTCGSHIQSVFGSRVTCSLRRQSCLKEKMKKYSIDLSRKLVRKALKDLDVTNTMYPKLRPYYRTDGHVYRTRRYGLECSCLHFLHIVATMRKVDGQVSGDVRRRTKLLQPRNWSFDRTWHFLWLSGGSTAEYCREVLDTFCPSMRIAAAECFRF